MSIRNIIKAGLAGDARMAETSGHNQDIINDAARYNKFMENQQKILQFGAQQKQGQELKAKLNELALSTGDPNRTDSYDPNLSGAYDLAASSINPLTGEMNKDYLEVAGFGAGISKAKAGADAAMQRLLQGQQFQSGMQEDRQAFEEEKLRQKRKDDIRTNPKQKAAVVSSIAPELTQQFQSLLAQKAQLEQQKKIKPNDKNINQQLMELDGLIGQAKQGLDELINDDTVLDSYLSGQKIPRQIDTTEFDNSGNPLITPGVQVPNFKQMAITPDPRLIQQRMPQQQPSGVWPY